MELTVMNPMIFQFNSMFDLIMKKWKVKWSRLRVLGSTNRFSSYLVHYYITICCTGVKILNEGISKINLKFDEIHGFSTENEINSS